MSNSPAMSDAVLHILLALHDQPRHGYAIVQEIETRTKGSVSIGTGTLYSALKRLRNDGLIEETPDGSDATGGRIRRTYRLSERGRTEVEAQTSRLRALLSHARQKRVLSDPDLI